MPDSPEDERTGVYDTEEEVPWDFDNVYPFDPREDVEEE